MKSMGVVVKKYMCIDFLILLIPTPPVSVLYCNSIPILCSFLKCFSFLYMIMPAWICNQNLLQ